jgi:hypothetical protein
VARVTRLLTWVDIDDRSGGESIRARLDAVLDDGRRLVLLDDRGWSGSGGASAFGLYGEDIEETARMVVGPDGPGDGITQEEMDDGHWRTLTDRLRVQGVDVDRDGLRSLPHDVEVSERLQAQVARNRARAD